MVVASGCVLQQRWVFTVFVVTTNDGYTTEVPVRMSGPAGYTRW